MLKEKRGGGVFVLECDESLGNVLTDNEWAGRCVAYHSEVLGFISYQILKTIVYYKSLSDSICLENDYNWACFYSNKILCLGWRGNKILF